MSNSLDSLQMLRVHVAPVGFEVDRIVIPAIQMKADRVWLIAHNNPSEDKGHQFVESVQNKLKQARIDCLQTEADRTELFQTLRALRIIILKEKGNSILVNVSVGRQDSGYCFHDDMYDVQRHSNDQALLSSSSNVYQPISRGNQRC